jgi:hypothetical protein
MRNSVKRLSTLWPFVCLAVWSVGRVDAQILKCVSSSGEAYYTQVTCPPGTTLASAQPSSTDGSFGIKRIFIGSFSGKQTEGPGKQSPETLKIRVASKGAGYVFSIWLPDKGWNDLPLKVIPCTGVDFFGTQYSELKAVSGVCLEGAKSALFYTPNHNLKSLGRQLNTDFLLLLAAPFGGTVWEMTKD